MRNLPRCNRCGGLLMAGFRCVAPCCNNSPDYHRQERAILREQKKFLQDRFVGKRVAWKRGHHEGEGVVRDVRIHHGQIFYHFEDRSEGVKRARLDSWEVQND